MNDDSLTVFLVEVTGSELPKEISEMRHSFGRLLRCGLGIPKSQPNQMCAVKKYCSVHAEIATHSEETKRSSDKSQW
jgi:hypothetical protein